MRRCSEDAREWYILILCCGWRYLASWFMLCEPAFSTTIIIFLVSASSSAMRYSELDNIRITRTRVHYVLRRTRTSIKLALCLFFFFFFWMYSGQYSVVIELWYRFDGWIMRVQHRKDGKSTTHCCTLYVAETTILALIIIPSVRSTVTTLT